MVEVALRSVEDADLDALFNQMRDPESVQMAAFTAKDPNDREAFDSHMAKVRPLYACAASDSLGSLRVLQKAGFTIIGTEVSYASARDADIEETILGLN